MADDVPVSGLIAGVTSAMAAAVTFLVARRRNNGRIATTDAETLWKNLVGELARRDSRITGLETTVANLSSELWAKEQRIASLEVELTRKDGRIAHLESDRARLEHRVEELESELRQRRSTADPTSGA